MIRQFTVAEEKDRVGASKSMVFTSRYFRINILPDGGKTLIRLNFPIGCSGGRLESCCLVPLFINPKGSIYAFEESFNPPSSLFLPLSSHSLLLRPAQLLPRRRGSASRLTRFPLLSVQTERLFRKMTSNKSMRISSPRVVPPCLREQLSTGSTLMVTR